MLMLGFDWLPFFGFLLGRFLPMALQGKANYRGISLYSVQYILKATLAHPILSVPPQAAELFIKVSLSRDLTQTSG